MTNFLFRRSLEGAQTPDQLVSIATSYVVIDVIDIVPAIFAMLLVRAITDRQEDRRLRHERGELSETVPAFRPSAGAAPSPA